jgi:hypothetical protein
MSRVRISPTEWLIEEPQAAHLSSKVASVPCVPVGHMRPVLTAGAVFTSDRLGRGRKAWSLRPGNAK